MKYKKEYLEKLYSELNDYCAIADIFGIIHSNIDKLSLEDRKSFEALSELIGWDSRCTNSGVWTYYEKFGNESDLSEEDFMEGDNEIILKYNSGLGKFEDEELMNELDDWIVDNEEEIFKYFGSVLLGFKSWLLETVGV